MPRRSFNALPTQVAQLAEALRAKREEAEEGPRPRNTDGARLPRERDPVGGPDGDQRTTQSETTEKSDVAPRQRA